VTLNPPNEVKFMLSDEDKAKLAEGLTDGFKAQAKLTLINKSKSPILFKVSTNPCS
jgi:hypothetical protein